MTRLLEQAIATVLALPDAEQDEAARLLLQLAGIEQEPYALSREDHPDDRLAVIRARVRASLRARVFPLRALTHISQRSSPKRSGSSAMQRLSVEFRPSANVDGAAPQAVA